MGSPNPTGTWTAGHWFRKPPLAPNTETYFNDALDLLDAWLTESPIKLGQSVPNSIAYDTLIDAVNTIGSTPAVIEIPSGTWPVPVDLTVPSNILLIHHPGSRIAVSSGATLTIQGPIEAGPYQIFSTTGTGKVLIGPGAVKEILPEWWCTNASPGTTDMTAAINAALVSGGTAWSPVVKLGGWQYLISGTVYVPVGVSLIGNGTPYDTSATSYITLKSGVGAHAIMSTPSLAGANSGSFITNLGVFNNAAVDGVSNIYDAIQINHGNYWHIQNDYIYGSFRYGINAINTYGTGGVQAVVDHNLIRATNPIAIQWDSTVNYNEMAPGTGSTTVANPEFTLSTGWTGIGSGWAYSSNTALHSSGTTALSQSVILPEIADSSHNLAYNVWYKISGCSAGSVTASLGSSTSGTARTANGTYVEELYPNAAGANTLAFTPTTNFNGAITNVFIAYGTGIMLTGDGNTVTGNIIYSDQARGRSCIYEYGTNPNTVISENRLSSCDYGISGYVLSGNITNNVISGCYREGIHQIAGIVNFNCQNNQILSNGSWNTLLKNDLMTDTVIGGYGIYLIYSGESVIVNNNFGRTNIGTNNYSGPIYAPVLADSMHQFNLIENNYGADIQGATTPTLPCNNYYGDVLNGSQFITANGTTTTIDRLRGGCIGKVASITLGDTNTTLKQFGLDGHIYTFHYGDTSWHGDYMGLTSAWTYFNSTPAVGDCLYFGDVGDDGAWNSIPGNRIGRIQIYNATPAVGSASNLIWEYWNGAWTALTVSPTGGNIFSATAGYQTLKFSPPADSVMANLNAMSLPGTPASVGPCHWIRCRVTGVSGFSGPGTNQTNSAGVSYLNINGDFGPLTVGQTGVIKLQKMANGLWQEISRFIN